MALIPYQEPGVTVRETTSPQVGPILAPQTTIGLIGLSQGFQENTDQVQLVGTTATTLPGIVTQIPALPSPVLDPSVDWTTASGGNLATGTYYYEVTALNANGETTASNEVSITTSGGADETITLSWQPVTGATGYNIYRGTASGGENVYYTVGSITAFTDQGGLPTGNGSPPTQNTTAPDIPSDTLLSVLQVADAFTGTIYGVSNDYTVDLTNHTVTRVSNSAIPSGTVVNVTYEFQDSRYFDAIITSDYPTVESRFGAALSADGLAINSPISFAAKLAFQNGAGQVVIQPLFKRLTPGNTATQKLQPQPADVANVTTWQDSLNVLTGVNDLNVIVPVIGQSAIGVSDSVQLSIEEAVLSFINTMLQNQEYLIGIFGEDSSASIANATETTLQSHAGALKSAFGGNFGKQSVFVNTSRFAYPSPTTNRSLVIGGQYVAAAIAGMLASQPVWEPLTNEVISGITQVLDPRMKTQMNADAQAGMLVVYNSGPQSASIRHSITLDNTSSATRALSVVRSKYYMLNSLVDTLNSQIIGRVVADGNAPFLVNTTVIGVLQALQNEGALVAYADVQSQYSNTDPTRIAVRFDYLPAFPLDYIDISFSIDLNSGDFGLTTSANGPTGAGASTAG